MSKRAPALLVQDILQGAERILRYTADLSFDDFMEKEVLQDAVARNFEIIGEAANRLPAAFREEVTLIEWDRIRGFRNRIVHEYFGVDYSIVWEIRTHYLPDLYRRLKDYLAKQEPD